MKITLVMLAAIVWFFSSCAPATPEARIAKNPALFDSLPIKQQELVRQGEISRGMSTAAVSLAWGNPSRRYTGMQNGSSTERWDYAGSQPVYSNQFGYGFPNQFGNGFGGYCNGYGNFNSFGFAPEITYIPYRRATVLFKNQRVDSWEKIQSPSP
jgi:hypothetical protein